MLLFKKKFLPAIRSGDKTQTIRVWRFRRMRAGQRSYIPGVGYIRVLAVDSVELDKLSDEDARLDGVSSAEQLHEELQALYGEKLADGYGAYRVSFEVMEDQEAEAHSRPESKSAD